MQELILLFYEADAFKFFKSVCYNELGKMHTFMSNELIKYMY